MCDVSLSCDGTCGRTRGVILGPAVLGCATGIDFRLLIIVVMQLWVVWTGRGRLLKCYQCSAGLQQGEGGGAVIS